MFDHFIRVRVTDYKEREVTSWGLTASDAENFHSTVPLQQPGIEAPFFNDGV
jgi:hypothetical protein